MTTIRLADSLDEFDIFRLCAIMHEEQPHYALAWEKISPMVRLATRHESGIIGVIGDRGDIKGAVFLIIESIWYSNDYHLMEYFNFVRPDSRRSTYAKDLITYSKSCADALRLPLTMGVYSGIKTEAKVRLYRRMLPCIGAFFMYVPEGCKAIANPAILSQTAAE